MGNLHFSIKDEQTYKNFIFLPKQADFIQFLRFTSMDKNSKRIYYNTYLINYITYNDSSAVFFDTKSSNYIDSRGINQFMEHVNRYYKTNYINTTIISIINSIKLFIYKETNNIIKNYITDIHFEWLPYSHTTLFATKSFNSSNDFVYNIFDMENSIEVNIYYKKEQPYCLAIRKYKDTPNSFKNILIYNEKVTITDTEALRKIISDLYYKSISFFNKLTSFI